MLTLGIITDVHFARRAMEQHRSYADGLVKLRLAAAHLQELGAPLLLNLGDIADYRFPWEDGEDYLNRVQRTVEALPMPMRSLPGNHDVVAYTLARLRRALGQLGHQSFSMGGYRIIMLQTCSDGDDRLIDGRYMNWAHFYAGSDACDYLQQALAEAQEPVLLFTHELVGMSRDMPYEAHMLRDNVRVREIIERSGKVRAVIQGHYHWGDYACINGIPYFTLKGSVMETLPTNAYYLLQADAAGITLQGFGRAETMRYCWQ